MKNIKFGCGFVSFLMVLSVIVHWKVPVIPFQFILQQPDALPEWKGWLAYLMITGMLFVILNLIAAVGLFLLKKWSFIVSYLTIILTSIIGISYIPLVSQFFLPQAPYILMIFINTVVLLYVIYLDISYRKIR